MSDEHDYPRWVKVHDSHIEHVEKAVQTSDRAAFANHIVHDEVAPKTVTNAGPDFPYFEVLRDGSVHVLVYSGAEESVAVSQRVERPKPPPLPPEAIVVAPPPPPPPPPPVDHRRWVKLHDSHVMKIKRPSQTNEYRGNHIVVRDRWEEPAPYVTAGPDFPMFEVHRDGSVHVLVHNDEEEAKAMSLKQGVPEWHPPEMAESDAFGLPL